MKRILLSILIVFFLLVGCGEGGQDIGKSENSNNETSTNKTSTIVKNPDLVELPDNWAKLKYWQTLESPGEKRGEAVLRIQQCHHCRILDLGGLNLTDLPEILGDFDNLKNVYLIILKNNKLSELPDFIQKLKILFFLDISNNEIRGIKNFPSCFNNIVIDIRGNPVADSIKNKINSDANNSRNLEYLEHFILEEATADKINALIARRYLVRTLQFLDISSAKENKPFENWITHITTKDALNFSDFLLRLSDTADARTRVGLEHLKQRLRCVLRELKEHEDLSPLCFDFVKEALGECGNRVSHGLNCIEQAFLNARAERGEISPNELVNIIVQQFRLNKLETVISEKLKHLPSSTQVETYLAVQINLRDLWDLLIQEQDMLYPRLSGMTTPELDAIRQLLENVGRGAELLNFFAHHAAWQNYLKRTYSEEFECYETRCKALRDAWSNRPENMTEQQYIEEVNRIPVQIDEGLRELYINLTKQARIDLGISLLEENLQRNAL